MSGRRLWAGLQILDRQILCRGDHMGGCVDDLELTPSDDDPAQLHVTAVISGPGALLYRLHRRRAGRWIERVHGKAGDRGDDSLSIPFGRVTDIGSHVHVDLDKEELATASGERWVLDHVIGHIPGSRGANPPGESGDRATQ